MGPVVLHTSAKEIRGAVALFDSVCGNYFSFLGTNISRSVLWNDILAYHVSFLLSRIFWKGKKYFWKDIRVFLERHSGQKCEWE